MYLRHNNSRLGYGFAGDKPPRYEVFRCYLWLTFILLDQHCTSRLILDECCVQTQVRLPIHMELSSIEVIKRLVRIDV